MIELPNDIGLKLDWAERRLSELSAACLAYVRSEPVTLTPVDLEVQSVDGFRMWGVEARVESVPPSEVSLIAGDVVQNARAALDYLARALVVTSGGTPKDGPGGTQFPARTTPPARSLMVAGCKSQEILRKVVAVQPYLEDEPDRSPLARLNELNNVGKHQMIPVAVAAAAIPAAIALHCPGDQPIGVVAPFMRWFFDRDRLDPVVMLAPHDARPVVDGVFEATVTLEGDAWQTVNIVEDLLHMLSHIRHHVVPSFCEFFTGPWPERDFPARAVQNPHVSLPNIPTEQVTGMIAELFTKTVAGATQHAVRVETLYPEMSLAKGYTAGGAPLAGYPPR